MTRLTLYELHRLIHETLNLNLYDDFWVQAEISELRESVSGHCYLELVEKDKRGAGEFRAKARANAWRASWLKIKSRFLRDTGRALEIGLKVLLCVRISFHEVYGYSLTVIDIDPTYTIGDLAQRRADILRQLSEDGVLELNRELPLPRLLQRVAVISAKGAAGFEDFVQQLATTPYRFEISLFEAVMQGRSVEKSVIAALDKIAQEQDSWDVVVIIRGGGAVTDLDGFETYLLAANVAQFPLPIFTGIGHERDDTVIDFVAHTRFKTPTAVAAYLVDTMDEAFQQLSIYDTQIRQETRKQLHLELWRFEHVMYRYQLSAKNFSIQQYALIQGFVSKLERETRSLLLQQHRALSQIIPAISRGIERSIEQRRHQIELLERSVQLAHPERLLQMGYALCTTAKGDIVSRAEELRKDDSVVLHFVDGMARSEIKDIDLKK